ncbi:MAG: hypothetical protein ING28_16930 [Roseomonas sp.]|nr:hypothetical protein [Roseomonas sp.]
MPLTITPDQEPETPAPVEQPAATEPQLDVKTPAPVEQPGATEPQPDVNRDTETFMVVLPLRYAYWLRHRADLFGDKPEAHVERILREYKAQYDQSPASTGRLAPPEKGETAVTFRRQ